MAPIYLSEDDVAAVLDEVGVDEVVDAVREGYRERGDGAPAAPRTALTTPAGGLLTTYLAILPDTGAMGGYLYNGGFGATDNRHTMTLYDAGSGEFLAHIDGSAWNPLKTGAAGAVGVDALSRDDASTLGLVGSGRQARGQLVATNEVRDLDRVTVFSPTAANREAFAAEMDDALDAEVVAVDRARAAVADSDVVITATRATEPVFEADDLSPGTHVTAMGQYDPDARELDAETVARATYVPDLRQRALQDAGSFLHALRRDLVTPDHIHAELGEVVAGHAVGRRTDEELTIFDSGGTGVETVAAAALLYRRARELDLGTAIPPAADGP